MPNGVFNGCSALLSVTLPASVGSLGDYVFKDCTSLETITVLNPVPPTVKNTTFYNVSSSVKIEVPSESVDLYKNTEVWKTFVNIREIEKTDDTPTAIESVKAEKSGAVEYFNILGVKVENPTKGLYIKRCGNKAYKVML